MINSFANSYGIYINGSVVFANVEDQDVGTFIVNGESSTSGAGSFGIYATGNIDFNGPKVVSESGNGQVESTGIKALGNINIQSGEVYGIGHTSRQASYGFNAGTVDGASGKIIFSGGHSYAKAQNKTDKCVGFNSAESIDIDRSLFDIENESSASTNNQLLLQNPNEYLNINLKNVLILQQGVENKSNN